ncbi:MAG: MFS transporter [Rhodospirillaceae bacterium]|nr:MFS transporter [Rhodospirillaceae bacterium]
MDKRRWLVLLVVFVARTSMGFQFQSVASLSPFIMNELDIAFATLGTLIGLFMLPGVAVSLPSGALSRRFADKTIAVWGLLGMVAGGAILGISTGLNDAILGRLISGAGAVLLNVVLTKMVVDRFSNRQQIFAMSLLVTSWPFGIGLALSVEPLIAEAATWQIAMWVTSAFCAISLILMWMFYHDLPKSETHAKSGIAGSKISRREMYLVSLVGLIWMLFNVGYIFVVSFTPIFLSETGASPAEAGIVTSLATWTLIASVPLGGYMASKLGDDKVWMFGGFIMMAAAMIALPYTSTIVAVLVIGIAAGPPAGAIMAAAGSVLRPSNRGLGMGIFYTWYYIGMAALPFAGGLVRDLTGKPEGIFLFGGFIMGSCALVLVLFRYELQRQPAYPNGD